MWIYISIKWFVITMVTSQANRIIFFILLRILAIAIDVHLYLNGKKCGKNSIFYFA